MGKLLVKIWGRHLVHCFFRNFVTSFYAIWPMSYNFFCFFLDAGYCSLVSWMIAIMLGPWLIVAMSGTPTKCEAAHLKTGTPWNCREGTPIFFYHGMLLCLLIVSQTVWSENFHYALLFFHSISFLSFSCASFKRIKNKNRNYL